MVLDNQSRAIFSVWMQSEENAQCAEDYCRNVLLTFNFKGPENKNNTKDSGLRYLYNRMEGRY